LQQNACFSGCQAEASGHFVKNHEKFCGRNDAAPEALSAGHMKRIASENNEFSFYLVGQNSRKTAQCCLENLFGRAIAGQTAINELPERSQANHEMRIQLESGRLTNLSVAAYLKVQSQYPEERHAKPRELPTTALTHYEDKIVLCGERDKYLAYGEKERLVVRFHVSEQARVPYAVSDILAPAV
jgi:hypothetical protein